MKPFRILFLLGGCLPLMACLSLELIEPTGTPLPTETATPTPTIVWFPPTATPTRLTLPTLTATPELNPGIGEVLLKDVFSNETVWDVASAESGSAAISRNRLTIAVQPGYYLASMRRQITFTDFYAEVTARPSLCRGEDNYGMVVRGVGSSFYRFVLTCDRQVRAERITGGTRLPLQEPLPSGDAPGAPGEVRMGLWAVGNEMRLFLNGRYQFTVTDPSFPSGGLGVFVRAAGDTPATVTFSDLAVYEVDYTLPTRTPLPTP